MNSNINKISNSEKINYNSIDLFKFLCAILVLAIHIQPFSPELFEHAGYLNIIAQKYLCRIAVPFYFVASGFLLFRKINLKEFDFSFISKYCFKILCLFGIWSIISYSSPAHHLWYLEALVVATLIVGFLLKQKVRIRYIALLAIILYVIGMSGDSCYRITETVIENNFSEFIAEQSASLIKSGSKMFMGIIFVLTGAAFSQKKIRINTICSVLGFFISMGLLLAEAYSVKHYGLSEDTNMYIFLIPVTIFLFDILLKIKLKDRKIYPQLRTISIIIYCSHLLIKSFVEHLFAVINHYCAVDCSAFLFITTLILSVIFAAFIEHVSQKEKFKWLQHLYK